MRVWPSREGESPAQWLVAVSCSIELSLTCPVSAAEPPREGLKAPPESSAFDSFQMLSTGKAWRCS